MERTETERARCTRWRRWRRWNRQKFQRPVEVMSLRSTGDRQDRGTETDVVAIELMRQRCGGGWRLLRKEPVE